MSKKLILFLMVLLFGSANFSRAEVVEIGDQASTLSYYYYPVNMYFNYSLTQQIYDADEIGMAGTINSISFYYDYTSSFSMNNVTLYMKHVTKDVFASNTDMETISQSDIVWNGTFSAAGSGWVTIVLDTPFDYDGESNLLVAAYDGTSGYPGSSYKFKNTACEGNKGLHYYSDSYNPDPYNTASFSGSKSLTAYRANIQLDITEVVPPTPPTPTGNLTVVPNPFEMGDMPTNAWMEPYTVKITNNGDETTIEGTLSNTSGVSPFSLNKEVSATLENGGMFDFDIEINTAAEDGEYTEEFTMFYTGGEKSIVTIPVTSTFYTAIAPDVVEFPGTISLSYSGGIAEYVTNFTDLHANYLLPGFNKRMNDAVFTLNLTKDSRVAITTNDGVIALYTRVNGFQPTADIQPLYMVTDGDFEEDIVLKGNYYVIVASDNLESMEVEVEQYPAPSELTALTPADQATGLTGNINLTWEGGENATEYRVLFGTSPTNMPVVKDWTKIDDNYGTFNVTNLVQNNTQYFWQIQARNSEGQVQTTRRGFTTALTTPNTVTATPEQIFVDGSTLIKWKHSVGGGGVLPETQIGSGTTANSYLPSYSFYNYSLTQQIYTADEIGGAGVINSISFYNSGSTKTRNYTMYLVNTTKETFTSGTDWIVVTADDQVFQGNVEMTAAAWTTITLAEPFNYTGDNLAIVVDDNTGSYSSGMSCYVFNAAGSQAIRIYNDNTNYNPLTPSSYSGTALTVKNQIIINKESKGGEINRSFLGFNVYDNGVKLNETLLTEKQYLVEGLEYSMPAAHPISVTAVYDEGESELATPAVNVYVSGYATIQGRVTELISHSPIAGVSVRFFGKDEFNNDVNYEAITNNNGQYTMEVKVGTYNRGMAMFTGMETVETTDPVVLAFDGVETVDFVMHEVYNPVMSVIAEEVDPSMARIFWSMTHNLRGVSYYTLYRKAILKEAALVPADSVMLVDNYTDTLNVDFNWNNMLPGLYQYGVSAVYPSPAKGGNRDQVVIGEGTSTSYVVPFNSLWGYSYVEQLYLAEEIGTPGMITSIAFNLSGTSSSTNDIDIFMVNTDKDAFASNADYVPVTEADMVFSGQVTFAAGDWTVIELDNPFFYDGTNNLMIGMHEYTSGYSSRYFYYTQYPNNRTISFHSDSANPDPYNLGSYSGTVYTKDFAANITIDITPGGGGGGTGDDPVTPITWSNVLPKDMETTVTVNVTVPVGSVDGTYVEFINQFEEGTDFITTLDETGTVTFDNFRKGEYLFTVALDKYTTPYTETPVSIWDETTYDIVLSEIFAPVDAIAVSGTGFARWTEMLPVDRLAEKYFLKLDGAFLGETTDNYYQFEGLEEGTQYTAAVAVVYSLGMSEYVQTTFTYTGCEGVPQQVEDLAVDTVVDMNVTLVWNGGSPTPTPPTPPTPPTGNTFDFDDGTMQGWTTIDANNDGYDWVLGSQCGGIYLVAGASLSGSGHNSSADLVVSGSYSNVTNQAITPNNFLVSPNKAEYTAVDFWACGQDASWASEHFGVFVSTAGNTAAADFTMVQEWTMTAKGEGAMSIGRDGNTRAQGSWHEYTVDLSAYAGQEIWVAIRHFNCSDMFMLDVDDITLGEPEKAAMDVTPYASAVTPAPAREMWDLVGTFSAAEGGQYGVATDGEYLYTSNWGYSSAAHQFWKYDLEGNQIEGFEISGCGTFRGIAYDGEYFYGVANSSTIYCVDFNSHTVVSTVTSAYGAMRCITYDPVRDGFWVVGNWEGNLTLVNRSGAIVQVGPTPSSASDVAYFKDDNNEEHVYVHTQPGGSGGYVYDYNITTGVYSSSPVLVSSTATPGASGSSGGLFVGPYNDKICLFANLQQSPNLIGIFELSEGGSTPVSGTWVPNKYNIMVDGELVAATSTKYFTYECPDFDPHVYTVVWVDANYNVSCEASIEYEIHHVGIAENDLVNAIYPNPTSGDLHINAEAMTRVSIVNTMGQVVYEQNVNADAIVVDMAKFEAGVYMVNIYTENGSSVKRVTVVK